MKRVRYLSLFYFFILVFSCQGTREVTQTEQEEQNSSEEEKQVSVEYTVLDQGVLYGAGEEGFEAGYQKAETVQEMLTIVQKMNSVNEQVKAIPASHIEFLDESVMIFLFDKVRGTGGHKFKVSKVATNGKEIIIETVSNAPEGAAPSVMTQPFLIIGIDKNSKPIIYRSTEQ